MNFDQIYDFIIKNKYFFIIISICFFVILLIFIITKNDTKISKDLAIKNESNSGITSNYYEDLSSSWNSSSTPVQTDLETKLTQEWKITSLNLKFNNGGFINSEDKKANINSNIRLEIDASETWLPDWTNLELSIPEAWISEIITTPSRYKYSLFFNSTWKKEVVIKWEWVQEWAIKTTLNIK
jgi:hypothetical protein